MEDAPTRILVVEDEERIAAFLEKGLRAQGFAVDWVTTGREALHLASDPTLRLVILDLGLPDIDGMEVLSSLRREGNTVPVIVLTARAQAADRAQGLAQGADDYMVKPFSFSDLLERIRALAGRRDGPASGQF